MTFRTHAPIDLNLQTLGQTVQLAGWVQRRRDHGGVIFIDLRDRENIVQLVVNPAQAEIFAQAERLRAEWVISVKGTVNVRPEGTRNANLPTGDIEIVVSELTVLNRAEPLPFQLDDTNTSEETRLRYRYLDLRRVPMQRNLRLRAQVTRAVRDYLDNHGFIDIETPILTRATPEGARDYLVPSRTHEHSFFALPQSPQLFKQLLMVSGFDRYYQIARCFRDEDLRADRQPEFTQIDIETAFLSQEEIINLAEGMAQFLFKTVLNVDLGEFPRMTWAEAMRNYGSDKPDLRNPLKLVDVADLVANVDFKVFSAPARDPNCRVTALRVPQGSALTRKQIDDYTAFVAQYKARGLAYIKINSLENGLEGFQSPIAKFLGEDILRAIVARVGAETGDLVFFGADTFKIVSDALGALRLKIGRDLNLVQDTWQPLWVVDFPMFEYDSDESRWVALHHPFTAPKTDDLQTLRDDPSAALSRAYDMVLNGTELGGGSVRIFQPDMQRAVFDLLGISPEEAQEKFGFLLEALQFGAPPHGGLAFGLDRLVMLMAKQNSIRDVIPFPKTQSAACLLTNAPGSVDARQLKELHIRLREKITK